MSSKDEGMCLVVVAILLAATLCYVIILKEIVQ